MVDTGGSPGSLQVLVKRDLAALEACDQVNTSIEYATDDAAEVTKQFQMQLTYLRNGEDANAKARDHAGSLINDLSSTSSKKASSKGEAARREREKKLEELQQAKQEAEEAAEKARQMEEDLEALDLNDGIQSLK